MNPPVQQIYPNFKSKFVKKEMPIKTTSRLHLTPVRMAIIKIQTANADEDVGAKGLICF
jgi:hypothetical protein